ncbi:MAG: hypothetical protein M0R21_02955 [Lentimicrobiaceae bacterium]|nr:hypothetical protein [Lentimicrobiaceae bacterium]
MIKEEKPHHSLPDIWLKASVIGGLWASVEIIVGSFLHNLRIPFAGSILAAFGVMVLVAFSRIWKEKGLFWRAGLVCALMKSISPSSVILGPMIGIMLEALLLEFTTIIAGKNLAAMIVGGVLAVLSALMHKIFSLLVLYGFNVLKIYLNIFYFACKQLGIQHGDPWAVVNALISIYVILGVLASITGWLIGNKARKFKNEPQNILIKNADNRDIFLLNSEQTFSLFLFILNLLSIPIGLILLEYTKLWIGMTFIVLYLAFCIFYYKSVIKRLKKRIFWIQLLILTLLSGIFWRETAFKEGIIHWQGVMVGIEMDIRAILVVIGFSSISIELKNPLIKAFLFKRGLKNIYLSVSLAFNSLPAMIQQLAAPNTFFRHPFRSLAKTVLYAGEWLETFRENSKNISKQ